MGRTIELVLADLDANGETRLTLSTLPELDTTTLGGSLRKARLEAGLRQQDVARILGVHLKCISNWENGRSRPRWLSIEDTESAIATHRSEQLDDASRARPSPRLRFPTP